MYGNQVDFGVLVGKTITQVHRIDSDWDNEKVVFVMADGTGIMLYHNQDCCENVYLDDVTGDFARICNTPVLVAYESSNQEEENYGSQTWTFYHIATVVDTVVLRWIGQSNGYYSEGVDVYTLSKNELYDLLVTNYLIDEEGEDA